MFNVTILNFITIHLLLPHIWNSVLVKINQNIIQYYLSISIISFYLLHVSFNISSYIFNLYISNSLSILYVIGYLHSSLTSPTNCDLCTPVKGDNLSHCEQNSPQHWLWYIFSCGLMAVKLNSMTMGVWVVYGTPFPAPWHPTAIIIPGSCHSYTIICSRLYLLYEMYEPQ